mgnify:CR=1 FL=1
MISAAATAFVSVIEDVKGFSAIARSVMISAEEVPWEVKDAEQFQCYSS